MFEVTCLDKYGEIVTSLTQWDVNQKLYIEDSGFIKAPLFQFCNKYSEKALGVQSILNNGVITVDIPNDLLRQSETIYCYVFLRDDDDSGKTLQVIRIPVRPRIMPTDYEYSDNIHVVYIFDLILQVEDLEKRLENAEAIRVSSENIRIANENQRIVNETQRQVSTSAAIQACKEQTNECNQATVDTLKAKETVDSLLYDIDGGNAYTNPDYMFQIDGGNCEGE